MSLSFVLHAKNSSGHQMLDIYRESDGTYSFRLWGDIDGNDIQVDFCPLDRRDMDDFISFLSIYTTKEQSHD
jgi:hypothetical protein